MDVGLLTTSKSPDAPLLCEDVGEDSILPALASSTKRMLQATHCTTSPRTHAITEFEFEPILFLGEENGIDFLWKPADLM